MKKAVLIAGSIFFYIAAFLALWELLFRGLVSNTFIFWSFPLVTGAYFLLAGELFCKRLSMRRLSLWLWMNGIGYPLCWVLLLLRIPFLLYAFVIFVFLLPMTVILALFSLFLAVVMLGVRRMLQK